MLQTPGQSPSSSYIIGIKIDGSNVNIVYGNPSGMISERISFEPDPEESFQGFLGHVSQYSDKLLNIVQAQRLPLPEAVSIAISGSYNRQQGILIGSRDFSGWQNIALKSQFQLLFNLPVYIEKSAKAGALAEMLFGSAQELKDFSFIEPGTNLTIANVIDGIPQSPSEARAGSVGRLRLAHLISSPEAQASTLNEWCSSFGIVSQALRKQSGHWDPQVTIYQIINSAKNNDPYAIDLITQTGTILGHGLAPYIHLLRQESIILGFPHCLAGELISEPVFKAAQAATGLGLDEMPKIFSSTLGARLPELQALAPAIFAIRNQSRHQSS